jgi:Flp pilus assembly protein TadG
MASRSAARGRRRPAQAVVEFALGVTVFLSLILATFDLARAYLAYTVVTNAAREASRYGATHCCTTSWEQGARQAGLNLAVGIDGASLVLTPTQTTMDGLTYVTVSGSYPFHSLTPLVRALLGDPINMSVNTSALAG